VGKSFLASALGHHACIHGHSVAYYNVQKQLLKIRMARAEGTLLKFFDKHVKTDLLILDDCGLTVINQQQCLDLMEITEDRHSRRSTIVASQLPVASWYGLFAEVTLV
jgi:DNA replication protein DnaC